MHTPIGTSRSFGLGLVASLACHAGTAYVVVRVAGGIDTAQNKNAMGERSIFLALPDPEIPTKEEPLISRLRLGIEKSSVVTETWLGFSDPSDHSGPLATVEQGAMSLRAAGHPQPEQPAESQAMTSEPPDSDVQPQVTVAIESESSPEMAPEPASVSVMSGGSAEEIPGQSQPGPFTKGAPEPDLIPTPREATEASGLSEAVDEPANDTVQTLVGTEVESLGLEVADAPLVFVSAPRNASTPEVLGSTPNPAVAAAKSVPTGPEVGPSASAPPMLARAGGSGAAASELPAPLPRPRRVSGDRPGVLSDRESVAAALKEAIDVKIDGRPAAAEGLEIKTTNPRWSITTQLTSSPKNPVVWMAFGRNGKVIDADFLSGENTGWTVVDEPLLHAIFAWRAKGVALDELPDSDPRAAVRVVLRITLRGP